MGPLRASAVGGKPDAMGANLEEELPSLLKACLLGVRLPFSSWPCPVPSWYPA